MTQPHRPKIKILLCLKQRLLRELFRRAFEKMPNTEIVGESIEPAEIRRMVKDFSVDWIAANAEMMENGLGKDVKGLFSENPHLSVLGIALDGSFLKLRWLEMHERDVKDPTLEDIVDLLVSGLKPDADRGRVPDLLLEIESAPGISSNMEQHA